MGESISSYQIVLIVILGLNLIFWILVICWRIFLLGDNSIANRYARAASLSRMRRANAPELRRQMSVATINPPPSMDVPPPYDEAVKNTRLAMPPIGSAGSSSATCAEDPSPPSYRSSLRLSKNNVITV